MAAPHKNQFWKLRAKHGRSKIFSSPNQLWNAAVQYFEAVEENPILKPLIYQGVNTGDYEKLPRAMTMKGFCIFLNVNHSYFNDFENALDLTTRKGKGFSEVLCKIRQIIDTQKFEGASVGIFNPNIIARDLGLVDKKNTQASIEIKPADDMEW